MFYYYIAYPIIGIFFFVIIMTIIILIVKRKNQRRIAIVTNSESINHRRNSVNLQRNLSQSQNIPNNAHFINENCVFGDSEIPRWRLSCGGNVCNNCIVNVSTALITSEVFFCPICKQGIHNFHFINSPEIRVETEENIDDVFLNTSQTCNICFGRITEKKIDCCSSTPHMLCAQCYEKLINVQKIKLCPFCRTLVKSNTCEEQAPVILSTH